MEGLKKLELTTEELGLMKAIFEKVNIPANLAKIFVGLMEKVEALNVNIDEKNSN